MTTATETEKPQTNFVKITRPELDKAVRVGTSQFIDLLPTLADDQLAELEQWINEQRARKTENTYLTFPVRKEKQLDAGRMYLRSLGRFNNALREELDRRAAGPVEQVKQLDIVDQLLATL